MPFLVIERWPSLELAKIVVDPYTGQNRVFNSRELAEEEQLDCQNGLLVEIAKLF